MTPDTISKRAMANGAANGALRNPTRKTSNGTVSNGASRNGELSDPSTQANGELSDPSSKQNRELSDPSTKENGGNMGDLGKSKAHLLRSYQRAVFAALFLGYACYTYNRKSVSYATPTLLAAGLVTTNTVGELTVFVVLWW